MTAVGGRRRGRAVAAAAPGDPAGGDRGPVVLRARGLAVDRGRRRVVDAVDLELKAGELLALVGPNGAGKSTLLHTLSGDLPATAGTLELDGHPLEHWSPGGLGRRRAVLPQAVTVSFPFTVREIVLMGRAPWAGVTDPEEDDAAVDDALRATDMTALAHRRYPSLSGGEQARASLARVLAQRAPLLLLDEPTAALDVRHQELVLRVVRERVDAGDAAVVVLHDLGLAAAHADRIAVVAGGRVVADGPPGEALEAGRLSAVYQHPIEVLRHPAHGGLVVLPAR